jgi:hypothetical protein
MNAPFGFWIEINLAPFVHHPAILAQRITLRLGRTTVTAQISNAATLAWYFPAQEAGGGILAMVLPDHARPSDIGAGGDTRDLAVQVRSLRVLVASSAPASCNKDAPPRGPATPAEVELSSAMPITSFLTSFEPLIGNCEFGFLQRRCGAEPLALLLMRPPMALSG